jgi:hypothetical protein
MSDLKNDALHVAWGAWVAFCFVAFPATWAVVLAVLPRELEQAYHAKKRNAWSWREHLGRWKFWGGKSRDLAGFWIGAFLMALLFTGGCQSAPRDCEGDLRCIQSQAQTARANVIYKDCIRAWTKMEQEVLGPYGEIYAGAGVSKVSACSEHAAAVARTIR